MENEIFEQICTMLDEAVNEERTICVCMKCKEGNILATFVPNECNYQDGIYIMSVNDDIVNINDIDEISYDEMEDEYEIRSGSVSFCISLI